MKLHASINIKFDVTGTLIVTISLGQRYHNKDHFKATASLIIDLLKEKESKQVVIVIADTLQRHNSLDNIETAKENLKTAGKVWISKNQESLDLLKKEIKNIEIIHWDQFIESEDFSENFKTIKNLYENDEKFKNAVNETSKYKSEKKEKIENSENKESNLKFKNTENAINYILEESAVLLLWAKEYPDSFIIYPTQLNSAMIYLQQKEEFKIAKNGVINFEKMDNKYLLNNKFSLYSELDKNKENCMSQYGIVLIQQFKNLLTLLEMSKDISEKEKETLIETMFSTLEKTSPKKQNNLIKN